MQSRLQISKAAIELIKAFEGYQPRSSRLPEGGWTIGYGHTLTAREGVEIPPADAEALLLYDLIGVTHAVNEWVFTQLEQNQFDALCAFAFAIGLETFRRSEVLKRVNAGDVLGAAAEMELWRLVEIDGQTMAVDALVRRRAAEKALFLKPQGGWAPAPSAILRPRRDDDGLPLTLDDVVTVAEAPPEDRTKAFPSQEMQSPSAQAPEDLTWIGRIAKIEADSLLQADPETPGRMGVVSLSMIGLLGLVLLGVSLYRTPNAAFGAGPVIGWAIGLGGLALFCAAAYLLLDWLGRVGDKEE